ncbi:MAG: cytochrome c [Blastocatellia bacterium]|nr:cytochrome c [Blastocatellia bacterium]
MIRSVNQVKKLVVLALAISLSAVAFLTSGPSQAAGAPVQDIAALYRAKCASCHAADGSGNTPAGKKTGVRDLRSAEVQGQSDAVLYNITAKGKNKMPGYEKSLGADKCKELVAYIRKLKP